MKKKLMNNNSLYSVIILFVKKKSIKKTKSEKTIISYSSQLSHLMVTMAVITLETDFWDR